MRGKPLDPKHLDIRAFADRSGELTGELPLQAMRRLCDSAHPEAPPAEGEVARWQADAAMRKVRGSPDQPWLNLHVEATVRLTCQRCLQAVTVPLQVDSEFRFVPDEATAAELDADSDEDLLVESRSLNLPSLIEDELLLALPLVPRHEGACPEPLRAPADPVAAAVEVAPRDKPFAALAGFKLRKTAD